MYKKNKAPLVMGNGKTVRTLEELRENFDRESLMSAYLNGTLREWLQTRYYDIECQAIDEIDIGDPALCEKICRILGIAELEEDQELVLRRAEAEKKLQKNTYDEFYFSRLDQIAFDQQDLAELIESGHKVIYLCEGPFEIPICFSNIRYIGINRPVVFVKDFISKSEYDNNGIELENVTLRIVTNNNSMEQLMVLRALERDPFEYEDEYAQRICDMEAVCCGTALLNKENYVIGKQKFNIEIVWNPNFLGVLKEKLPQKGYFLRLNRDAARNLYHGGTCQRVHTKFCISHNRLVMKELFIEFQGERYKIEYQPVEKNSAYPPFTSISTGVCGFGIHLI